MAFPTTGFTATPRDPLAYDVLLSNGVYAHITVNDDMNAYGEIDVLLPYLETALQDLKTAYELGESDTVDIVRSITGLKYEAL